MILAKFNEKKIYKKKEYKTKRNISNAKQKPCTNYENECKSYDALNSGKMI